MLIFDITQGVDLTSEWKINKVVKSIKLKRIYPKLHPVNVKKRIGKAILWGLIPIEPLLELLLLPATIVANKLMQKSDSEDWIEIGAEKITISEKELSIIKAYNIEELKDLKIHYCKNLMIEGEEDMDERAMKNNISRIVFTLENTQYEYFYEGKKKEILKLCEFYYSRGIRFKEYHDGRRVFMGKQPKYNEIQKLKKKYNIEW